MENQPAKRKKYCPNSGDGRISELPQPLLHNIVAFLSQEEATKTCVLSKSWRSIGPTRPKIEFNEMCYEENHKKFLSNLDSTLQVYRGREICLQEFILCVSKINTKSVSLLEKWFPIVLLDMGVKRFHLISTLSYFALPSIVFEAETLEELHLKRCRIESVEKVLSWRLRNLSFCKVDIEEEHLQKIMSRCPLIEHLAFDTCHGFTTIEVQNNNLKHFEYLEGNVDVTIKIYAPNVESIRTVGNASWLHHGKTFPCLTSLRLDRCRIDSVENVLSWHLRKVSFCLVHIEDEHMRKIMSSCPLIEHLALDACRGFTTVEVHNDNLKHFEYNHSSACLEVTIKIDVPNIESISIVGRASWLHHRKTFTCLKSLVLENVVLTQKDFDSISVNFCCLEDLKIHFCSGFEEFQLSSRSVKRLHLAVNGPTKAAIDLPNILSFELLCDDSPSITLTTNSSEWRSLILLKRELITNSDTALLFVKLNELLRALNHSRIHLHMRDLPLEVPNGYGGFGEPAVIESLAFSYRHPCSSLEAFLNYFFGSFRPRYIEESFYPRSEAEEDEDNMDAYHAYEEENYRFQEWYAAARAAQRHGLEDEYMDLPAYPETNPYGEENELIDRLWIFLMKKEREDRIWQQDLEEVSVETYGRNGVEWRCVQSENLSQLELPNNDDQKIRFQLKWRERVIMPS
ncbi:F-box/RNI-like superfamily protein [Striga asiatica]|uniref:F-box/RNI-like superfamily protein n=1 Tax=Striga asiatica TaxID=4170 RepID=A0A5A7QGY8_STRAF|nr:F-box/RNI-like superfamily protein [Striga asiatica]